MKEIRLNKTHHDTDIELSVGDKIIIELDSNPGTGFQWIPTNGSLTHFDKIVFDYKPLNETDAAGAGEITRIILQALKVGKGTFSLNYLQPWNPDDVEGIFEIRYSITENNK